MFTLLLPDEGQRLPERKKSIVISLLTEEFHSRVLKLVGGFNFERSRPLENLFGILDALQRQDAGQAKPDLVIFQLQVVLLAVELDPQGEVAPLVQEHRLDGVVQRSVDVGVGISDSERSFERYS